MNKLYGNPLLTSIDINQWNTPVSPFARQPSWLPNVLPRWNTKVSPSARQSSWLPNFLSRRKCRSHYIQYDCPHESPIIVTTVQGCCKCAKTADGLCEPELVEVVNAGMCPECEQNSVSIGKKMEASMDKIGLLLAAVRTGEQPEVSTTDIGLLLTDIGTFILDDRAMERLDMSMVEIGSVLEGMSLLLVHLIPGCQPEKSIKVADSLLGLCSSMIADSETEDVPVTTIGVALTEAGSSLLLQPQPSSLLEESPEPSSEQAS